MAPFVQLLDKLLSEREFHYHKKKCNKIFVEIELTCGIHSDFWKFLFLIFDLTEKYGHTMACHPVRTALATLTGSIDWLC